MSILCTAHSVATFWPSTSSLSLRPGSAVTALNYVADPMSALTAMLRLKQTIQCTDTAIPYSESLEAHPAAVVGSIIFLTSVIFVAGKPLISACLRMIASSFAR